MTGLSGSLVYALNNSSYASRKASVYSLKRSDDQPEKKNANNASKIRTALRKGTGADDHMPVSVVDSMQLYSQNLKKQRTKASNTMLEKKKYKYSFKRISSKIISSKTSTAARQVISQARREIQKLKDARRTGKYDNDEIDAAIDHAKAMERIARKKARHLEEEELAKRSSSGVSESVTAAADASEDKDPVAKEIDRLRKDIGDVKKNAENEEYIESEEITNSMIEDICKGMEEMLDQIEELNDLMDELVSDPANMDPEDIKASEMKHRIKEMKEITKADADYLKAVFEHYEAEKTADTGAVTQSPEGSVDIAL
ncbi:MAG: hypothetical protein J5910_10280 [Lachnospiraceae bacterium]|nr:hypothetical protein [Lachnospiraceae bacterium]